MLIMLWQLWAEFQQQTIAANDPATGLDVNQRTEAAGDASGAQVGDVPEAPALPTSSANTGQTIAAVGTQTSVAGGRLINVTHDPEVFDMLFNIIYIIRMFNWGDLNSAARGQPPMAHPC